MKPSRASTRNASPSEPQAWRRRSRSSTTSNRSVPESSARQVQSEAPSRGARRGWRPARARAYAALVRPEPWSPTTATDPVGPGTATALCVSRHSRHAHTDSPPPSSLQGMSEGSASPQTFHGEGGPSWSSCPAGSTEHICGELIAPATTTCPGRTWRSAPTRDPAASGMPSRSSASSATRPQTLKAMLAIIARVITPLRRCVERTK